MDRVWLGAIVVFSTALFATLSLALASQLLGNWWRRRRVAGRLRPVLAGRPGPTAGGGVHDLVRSDPADGQAGMVSRSLAAVPGLRDLNGLLEQSRAGWSAPTFLMLTLGLALGFGGAVLVLSKSWGLAPVAGLAGASFPYFYLRRRRTARFKQFEEEFPEAIDLLSRAIRAGHPLTSGVRMVAEEGPPEVAEEFRRAFEEQRFGIPFDEAILGMVDRTDLVDVRIFVIAVLVQREVGGNLAEILEGLSATIRRRFFLRRQLRVYTAQGRMTGYALAALPLVLGSLLYLLEPEYIGLLFSTTAGLFMVGTALVLQAFGVLWIRKIINIDM
jgi:tight adherence protein B